MQQTTKKQFFECMMTMKDGLGNGCLVSANYVFHYYKSSSFSSLGQCSRTGEESQHDQRLERQDKGAAHPPDTAEQPVLRW